MPERLTDDEWAELLKEKDEFKLAILGATAIEAEVDAAVEAAFAGSVPKELSPTSIRYELRLALAVGLSVLPAEWKPMFAEIARLRNDFAHGKIRAVTPARARHLVVATRIGEAPLPNEMRTLEELLQKLPSIYSIQMALLAARTVILRSAEAHQKRQAEEREIVADYRKGLLQTTIIRELLKDAPEESQG